MGKPNHRQMLAVWSHWRWLYRFVNLQLDSCAGTETHGAAEGGAACAAVGMSNSSENTARRAQSEHKRKSGVCRVDSPDCERASTGKRSRQSDGRSNAQYMLVNTNADDVGVAHCEAGWRARAAHPEPV